MMNSPHEVGEEASSLIGSRCREKTGWPTGKIVVLVVVVVLAVVPSKPHSLKVPGSVMNYS